jgi:DNA polymerase-3 subunit epsilon
MKWLDRWLTKRVALTDAAMARLSAWRALPEPDLKAIPLNGRCVVVDVESSGLDVRNDHLIAIGANAVEQSRIAIDAGFNVVLRQETVSDDANILVHRIGGSEQTGGNDPVEALLAFLDYIGKSPLVGYHAPFDEIIIAKATRHYLGEPFRRAWIDLADLAPALCMELAPKMKDLDDWADAFGIINFARHNALADALATAQLHLVLCERAGEKGLRTQRELLETAGSQAWLERHQR